MLDLKKANDLQFSQGIKEITCDISDDMRIYHLNENFSETPSIDKNRAGIIGKLM